MPSTLIINIVAIVSLVLSLAIVEARRSMERKKLRRRLGRMISEPQRKTRFELIEVPKICPCCERPMTEPMGWAFETTSTWKRPIFVCSVCLAKGPMNSILSAAAERAAFERRMGLVHPCDPSNASRATTSIPGGPKQPAGTF